MRVGWLDTAKGLAIAGIVLIHATSWSPSPSPEATWLLQRFLASLPVFFLVSGIVAGRSLTDPAATVRTLAARVLPLCYLYTLWQPVVLGYRVLRDVTAGTSVDLVGELLRVAASPIRPNGEIWYLWALALHLVVIWATRRLPTAAVLIPTFVMCAALIGWGRTALGDDTWHVLGPGLQGLPLYLFFTVVGARAASPIVARVERTGRPHPCARWSSGPSSASCTHASAAWPSPRWGSSRRWSVPSPSCSPPGPRHGTHGRRRSVHSVAGPWCPT